jgi:hypothetical protein
LQQGQFHGGGLAAAGAAGLAQQVQMFLLSFWVWTVGLVICVCGDLSGLVLTPPQQGQVHGGCLQLACGCSIVLSGLPNWWSLHCQQRHSNAGSTTAGKG